MAQLIVRNIEDEVVDALKRRATEHNRSAEAEHREILRAALLKDKPALSFKELLLAMPDLGDDEDYERRRDMGREIPDL